MRIGFVRWISDAPSGGNLYDEELATGLRRLGVEVVVRRVDQHERTHLAEAVWAEPVSLLDGILASGAPDLVGEAVNSGRSVTIVVHHFAADTPGLDEQARARHSAREAEALHAATGVVCTSRWAAAELSRRYGLSDVGVAPPGVEAAQPATGRRSTGVPRLLSVGSLLPVKDQLNLVEALAHLADLPWTACLVGSDTVDRAYAARVRAAVAAAGLDTRVQVPGAQVGDDLAAEWAAADLLIMTSRSETYGIVVLEGLARGIPAVVMVGTGAVEALAAGALVSTSPAGTAVPPADPAALAGVLRRWLTDPALAAEWRSAALEQRTRLPSWSVTAAAALAYLRRGELYRLPGCSNPSRR